MKESHILNIISFIIGAGLVLLFSSGPTSSYSGSMKVLSERGEFHYSDITTYYPKDSYISELEYKALAKMASRLDNGYIKIITPREIEITGELFMCQERIPKSTFE